MEYWGWYFVAILVVLFIAAGAHAMDDKIQEDLRELEREWHTDRKTED